MRSAFNGVIDEIPGIFVDNFSFPFIHCPRAYFLSHTHKDHTLGLHESELLDYLQQNNVKIYMTELSSAFVTYTDDSLKGHIRILKLGSTLVTLPETSKYTECHVNVKVMPAGHSCGSVMFMFEIPNKRVLYTGDFRIDPEILPIYTHFHDNKKNIITIDTVYMDTTFISKDYEHFPKRKETVRQAISEIEGWLERDGDNRVGLDTSASTGYEYVFNEIYEKLGLKIFVDSDRWKFYRDIQHLVPAITNLPNTRIHLCHYSNKDALHTKCLGPNTGAYNFLKLRFSAQIWKHITSEQKGIQTISNNLINVCFATHCSASELRCFINYLSPKRIVGFPNVYIDVTDIQIGGKIKRKCMNSDEVCKKVSRTEVKRIMQF